MIPREARLPCQTVDPRLFDVPPSVASAQERDEAKVRVSAALKVCRHCPWRRDCAQVTAADPPTYEVRGGRLWGRKGIPIDPYGWYPLVREPLPCGTRAAWIRHTEAGEEPCGPCEDAARAYDNERKRNKRTACAKGHKYTLRNTGYDARGARVCRTCHPDWKVETRPPGTCPNHHVLADVGVYADGRCAACGRARLRRYRQRGAA